MLSAMETDADKWLLANGLGKYCDVFRQNDVDMRALPHLSEEDLRELGLSLGHRRIFTAALARDATIGEGTEGLASDENAQSGLAASDSVGRVDNEAEHRHLSVIFIDIAGSTELAERLDPEDMRDLLKEYQDAVTSEVTRFGGQIAKFMGDGVLAHFGWPKAFEDHADRAVKSALAIIDAVKSMPHAAKEQYGLRVGIASGSVIVGDLIGAQMREDDALVGSVVNLAARIQAEASTGTVAISDETRKLIGLGFDLDDMGPRRLKGFDKPQHVFLVTGERALETRFEAMRGIADTPLVGRDEEMALLTRSWEMAIAGHGQVVLLSGEAGIGKSRIAQAIVDQLGDGVGELLRFQCAPYHTNSAFHPIIERLSHAAGLSRADNPETNFERIRAIAEKHFLETEVDAPIYAALLGVDAGDADIRSTLEPQALKHRITETLTRSVVERAARFPLLMIVEDAHWIDPSSLETFERIAELCGDMPVMMVLTHRPEWTCDWVTVHPHVSTLRLGRLSGDHVSQLIRNILRRPFEASLIDDLVDRTDGVPLFVEELARAIFDKNGGTLEDAIPNSLQGVLLARLERVSRSSRTVALVASVIGRDFETDILANVANLSESELSSALVELRRANIIYESSREAGAFTFRHALIQDAAYQAILRRKRRDLHGKVALALEKLRSDDVDREPELLARHYTEAGAYEDALASWTAATRRALERSATYEAVSHAKEALAVAEKTVGEAQATPELAKSRILLSEAQTQAGNLQLALKAAWQAAEEARSLDDPEIFANAAMSYMDSVMLSGDGPAPAIALCKEALDDDRSDDSGLRCRLLAHLARGHMMNGDFEASTRYGREAEKMARDLNDNRAFFNQLMSRFLAPVVVRDEEEVSSWRERVSKLLELAELSDDADRGRAGAIAAYVAAEMGDRDLMEDALRRLKNVGAVRQHMHMDWVWLHGRAMMAILDGDYSEAEKLAKDALNLGVRTHGSHVEGLYGVQMFTIRREQGRLAEVAPVIKRLLDEGGGDRSWKPGFALIAAELGHLDPARRMMSEMASDGFDLPFDAKYSATLGYLADTAIMIGDREMGETIYKRLLPYKRMTITIGVATVCHGAADRRLGSLAALSGDWASMEKHFESALEVDAAMRSAPCLAHSKADYARALHMRGRAEDADLTDLLAAEAMETAQKYGMVALQKRLSDAGH